MDIRRAVGILNEREWEWANDWTIARDGGAARQTRNPIGTIYLPKLVAIAIAKELERSAGEDLPALRKIAPVLRQYAANLDAAHIPDNLPLIQNAAGACTLAEFRAAVAELEGLL